MATRLKSVLSSSKIIEHLWQRPPTFLAPTLQPAFSTTSSLNKGERKHANQNRLQRARKSAARKEANLARRATLSAQRTQALGDPIRGIPTPFLRELTAPIPSDPQPSAVPSPADKSVSVTEPDASEIDLSAQSTSAETPRITGPTVDTTDPNALNHGIAPSELTTALQRSRFLTATTGPAEHQRNPEEANKKLKEDQTRHESASEAVARIVALSNASDMQRRKKSGERIVETFGRHNTDSELPPRPAVAPQHRLLSSSSTTLLSSSQGDRAEIIGGEQIQGGEQSGIKARAGPDTGSSEVQIGILTLKINALADAYGGWGRQDKVNKRNLRLLLHRRQKLCKYMMRQERGGPRWRNLVERLGLTRACWEGQIAVE